MACWAEERGVEAAYTAERLEEGGGCATARLFENSFFAGRSPHIQIHLAKYFYVGGASGTGHGTAHDYDLAVPVTLAGPGIAPGRYPGRAGPEDIAPTLATVLGLELAAEPHGSVLSEALVRGPG